MTQPELLEPIRYVAEHSDLVRVNETAIRNWCRLFKPIDTQDSIFGWPFPTHSFDSVDDEIDWWFICDSQAFCFWGYPQKWTISYQNKQYDGWWALLASFQRAIEHGVPLLDCQFLANLTDAQAQELFAGEPEIPLFSKRIEILRGIGIALQKLHFNRFHQFLATAPRDARSLIIHITKTFPGFDDTAIYKGKTISFYKKAQLFIEDLNRLLTAAHRPQITGMEMLTSEADYKIPALLRDLGILIYSPYLAKKVDNRKKLDSGSPEEVEIRANMLWAVHQMVQTLKPQNPRLLATTLDRMLWHMSQDKSLLTHPYHLTETIYY